VLTVGSLFSGIGGLDLGLERAGMRVAWQAEVDPYCRRVLARHWPEVPNLGDVTGVRWEDVERPDVVCGGFPCQPVSVAGRRRAQEDHRWLWPEVERCVRHLRPRYVLVENVPGLLVRGMGDVLGGLAALGYDAEWEGVPAAALGAPHLRWRIFVVAYADGAGLERHGRPLDGARERTFAQGCPTGRAGTVADTDGPGSQNGVFVGGGGDLAAARWAVEPDVGRMAYGIPARVDRLRGLGNAVVPQVAEWVGRRIVDHAAVSSGANRTYLLPERANLRSPLGLP
jgi:DNA (cytosine-5)-methyltransferase 1